MRRFRSDPFTAPDHARRTRRSQGPQGVRFRSNAFTAPHRARRTRGSQLRRFRSDPFTAPDHARRTRRSQGPEGVSSTASEATLSLLLTAPEGPEGVSCNASEATPSLLLTVPEGPEGVSCNASEATPFTALDHSRRTRRAHLHRFRGEPNHFSLATGRESASHGDPVVWSKQWFLKGVNKSLKLRMNLSGS